MDLMIAVLLILHQQALALDCLYAEKERFGGSCFPRDSCVPSRSDDEDHLWGNYTCECGVHCIRYGTCCANSPHVGKMLHVDRRGETCQKMSPSFPQSVLVVSRCSGWRRTSFRIWNKCESPDENTEDPMSMVPLTSLTTSVTYKNYFCALCNDDTQDVYMWDIALQLETKESTPSLSDITKDYFLENISYNKDRRAWGIVANDSSFYDIKFKFRVPPSIQKFVKKCYPNMVTQCGPSFAFDHESQYKCLSYYAPIVLQENGTHSLRKFRNIHCAICNDVYVTQSDFNICKLDTGVRKKKPAFSLALLLDVNRDDGDIVGERQVCGDREKWDPFFKKCRSLSCAVPGYVIKNGVCVAS